MRRPSAAAKLRELLATSGIKMMPCCADALGARCVEEAGFPLTFVSGFSLAATKRLPDTGLLSYKEVLDAMADVAVATSLPVIGDADAGYGNAINAKRTVQGFARAGLAGAMIEDQLAPKRCGHTRDKAVVEFDDAVARVRAAVDAAAEGPDDLVIIARTDARATHGLDEAIRRCAAFREVGADVTFLEAPRSVDEMRQYCSKVSGHKMANILEGGLTPELPASQLESLGYSLAAYPLTLLNASIMGMRGALDALKSGDKPPPSISFEECQRTVGFPEYYAEEARYRTLPSASRLSR